MCSTKVLSLIIVASVVGCATASAENACPTEPFETEINVIATAMAAEPLKPAAWYGERLIDRSLRKQEPLTDGVVSGEGGGLMSTSVGSLDYDAKRYVLVQFETQGRWPYPWGPPKRPDPMPNQVIRKIGEVTYTTTIARPTPEEARDFACLANRLLRPTRAQPPPPVYEPPADRTLPIEIDIVANRHKAGCEKPQYTDGHFEYFNLLVGRPGYSYDPDLPCAERADLEHHMAEAIAGAIIETTARADGSWEPPHVRSLAFDATDNLYLLQDPGTHRRRQIVVAEIAPSSKGTRLKLDVAETFLAGTFTVDGSGHVWVPASEGSGTVIYDMMSDARITQFDKSSRFHDWFVSLAMDANHNLYAASRSAIFRMIPGGEVTQLAALGDERVLKDYLREQYHIVVAPNGSLFISDASLNVIETMSPDGALTIVAGASGKSGATDGPGIKARFNTPRGIVLDREGNLYIADSGNHTIRRFSPDGQVSTLAGKHGRRATLDGVGASARFDSPDSIAINSAGVLYVTNGNDNLIRRVSVAGVVSTLNVQQFIDSR